MESRPLAVFDIDGVLADVRHRLRYVERKPKQWDAFFDAAIHDPPLAHGVALAQESAKQCEVVYVTGRPERCRTDTLAWFERHGLPSGQLSMRRPRDFRPARVAKLELLRRLAADRTVAIVVDAAELVCAAYEGAGFRVLRARWMSEEPVLQRAQEDEGRT